MENKQLTNRDFAFIYSPHLASYLTKNNHSCILVALHPKTKQTYSLFLKSDELSKSINEYRKQKQVS